MSRPDDTDPESRWRNVYFLLVVGMVLLFVVLMLAGQLVELL
jgi:hypothetical protein